MKLVFFFAFSALMTSCLIHADCTPNHCIACESNQGNKFCSMCLGTQVSGPLGEGSCSGTITPNCLIEERNPNSQESNCILCEDGYVVDANQRVCVKALNNCVRGTIRNGRQICNGCPPHLLLSGEREGCVEDTYEPKLAIPENCLVVGGVTEISGNRAKGCLRCEKGYTTDMGGCSKYPEDSNPACLQIVAKNDENKCPGPRSCRFTEGWFAVDYDGRESTCWHEDFPPNDLPGGSEREGGVRNRGNKKKSFDILSIFGAWATLILILLRI